MDMSHTPALPKPEPASIFALAGRKRVTKELYDQMYAAYLGEPTARFVADRCGVSRETATRAIERGYPKQGWQALRDRLQTVSREAARREDFDLVEAHRDTLRTVQALKRRILPQIEQVTINPADLNLQAAVKTLGEIAKLEAYLAGGPESRVEVRAGQMYDFFDGWTIEQLEHYAETGEEPEGL